jgi:hypothetical protein
MQQAQAIVFISIESQTIGFSKEIHTLFYIIKHLLLLLEELERALLGDVALLLQLCQRLLARGVLALGYNATLARLHQVLLDQATGSVLGGAVPDLRLGADRWDLRAARHLARACVLASTVVTAGVHLLYFTRRNYLESKSRTLPKYIQRTIPKIALEMTSRILYEMFFFSSSR